MAGEPHPSLPTGGPRVWTLLLGQAALLPLSLIALHCWFWVVTIALAFGPRYGFWTQLTGLSLALASMIGICVWIARRGRRGRAWLRWPWILATAWTLVAAAVWRVEASPFSQAWPIVAAFAISTWWLGWAWAMFGSGRPGGACLSLLAVLVLLSGTALANVRADGLDGAALPRVVFRLARPQADDAASKRADRAQSADVVPDAIVAHDPAADYPRFRGVDGLGTLHDKHLARDWSQSPPRLVWRRAVGAGWGSIAVAGPLVYTQQQQSGEECVGCYDRASGQQRWLHRDAAYYENSSTGDGPRATPTVDGGRVYTLGATGILNCLDAIHGTRLWTVNILTDTAATAPPHGMVGSPLVVGDGVVVSAGSANDASLVAYDKTTGKRVWAAGTDPAGYTSPQLVELDGVPQIVIVNQQTICGHAIDDGRVLWSERFANDQSTNCSQPYPIGPRELFASTDYGLGCRLIEISRGETGDWQATARWSSRTMQTKFSSAVVREGFAYGLDDGILECVAIVDGKRRWKRGRYGHGQLLLVDDLLVIQAEDGSVVLVEASSQGHRELGSFAALSDKTWNYPALGGNQLFVRNDREMACYELPVED